MRPGVKKRTTTPPLWLRKDSKLLPELAPLRIYILWLRLQSTNLGIIAARVSVLGVEVLMIFLRLPEGVLRGWQYGQKAPAHLLLRKGSLHCRLLSVVHIEHPGAVRGVITRHGGVWHVAPVCGQEVGKARLLAVEHEAQRLAVVVACGVVGVGGARTAAPHVADNRARRRAHLVTHGGAARVCACRAVGIRCLRQPSQCLVAIKGELTRPESAKREVGHLHAGCRGH